MCRTIRMGMFLPSKPDWMGPDLWIRQATETMQLIDAQIAHVRIGMINEHVVDVLHDSGYLVHAADCNNVDELRLAIDLGVDQLGTDVLTLALEQKAQLGCA